MYTDAMVVIYSRESTNTVSRRESKLANFLPKWVTDLVETCFGDVRRVEDGAYSYD